MEVKINKDIREYTEAVFFGMSLRQCVFSGIACGAAAGSFLLTKPTLGMETASWICVLSAFPFILMGFVRYNGLTFEKFLLAWFRSEVLMPRHLVLRNSNLYGQILGPIITELHKEDLKKGPANKHKPKRKEGRKKDGKKRAESKEDDWIEENPGLTEEEIDYENSETDMEEPEGFEIDHDMTYYEWLEAKKRWEEKKRMKNRQREQSRQEQNWKESSQKGLYRKEEYHSAQDRREQYRRPQYQRTQQENDMSRADSRRRKRNRTGNSKEGYE